MSRTYDTCKNGDECINPNQGSLVITDYHSKGDKWRNTICKQCCNKLQREQPKKRKPTPIQVDHPRFFAKGTADQLEPLTIPHMNMVQQWLCGKIGHTPSGAA